MITDKKNLRYLKAFIFDLDGTLLDSMQIWEKIYARPFEIRDIDMPQDYLMRVNHLSLDDCAEYTLTQTPLAMNKEELINVWRNAAHKAYFEDIQLKSGAYQLLKELKDRNVMLAVATALPYELFIPCLKRLNVYDLFDFFVSTDDVSRGKDSPEVYLKAASKFGLMPYECAVAEDSHVGIATAKAAGFFTVGVFDKASLAHEDEIIKNSDIYVSELNQLESALFR